MVNKFLIVLLTFLLFSCNQYEVKKDKIETSNTTNQFSNNNTPNTLATLLSKILMTDSITFNNQFECETSKYFLFFKFGHFFNKTEKNILVVSCPNDTIYRIKLYALKNNTHLILDSIDCCNLYIQQFDLTLDDYNFDGQTDIYVQISASNGYSLSRGHLIIIDPVTKKMNLHTEASDLANIKAYSKTKTVISESWEGYDIQNNSQLIILTNKWINGLLKTISKKDTIIN